MNIRPHTFSARNAAFTMVEIAICLAIIGLALVAIIGVLPLGMNVQRDNREETIVNQDSTIFLESIRNGVKSGTDLTNYIYAITNFVTVYDSTGKPENTQTNGYGYTGAFLIDSPYAFGITNNYRIIGLLSTPEFLTSGNIPTNNVLSGGVSNRIYAYVHAMSGPAAEKPPQDNPILIGDSFTYRFLVVNAPLATDTNLFGLGSGPPGVLPDQQIYSRELAANLHELRLTFAWPILPSGAVRPDAPLPQTQRTMVAGAIFETNDLSVTPEQPLYFYESQSFTNSP
jgi:type II secretory pathway pseudopilin PulG